ncbi:MAG: anti-sigma regulatory factor [Nitrospirae bacterium]|nr:anti-sigma regulatory factor [Nitrospirota bacterium]MBI3593723.1 anti-sigma regulatory factor [Nitrospirota bacterium]
MKHETRVQIICSTDIVTARAHGRTLASQIGFTGSDLTIIATAISEVARNIVEYAGKGEIILGPVQESRLKGIFIIAQDEGPGIADIDRALQDGYSTGNGLGLGLPGAKRLMDEFEIQSEVRKGTTVKMKKWLRRNGSVE